MNKPNEFQPSDLGEILFAAAVAQGRADALKAAAKKAAKELACRCDAYSFPHRQDGGRCGATVFCEDKQTQAEVEAEMLACFDATEARAINAGRY